MAATQPLLRSLSSYHDEHGGLHATDNAPRVNAIGVLGVLVILLGAKLAGGQIEPLPIGVMVVGGFMVLFYGIEAMNSKAFLYLGHIMPEDEFVNYISRVQQSEPSIMFHIQNYHTETGDKDGKSNTPYENKRVTTHSASMSYPIRGHSDETLSPEQMLAMFHLMNVADHDLDEACDAETPEEPGGPLILLCHCPLLFLPRDEHTKQDMPRTKDEFFRKHSTDEQHVTSMTIGLVGCPHVHTIMCILHRGATHSTKRPWWCNKSVYILSSLCFMSAAYRSYFYSKTRKVKWPFTKHYSVSSPETWTTHPISSLRESSDKRMAAVMKMKTGKADKKGETFNFVSPDFPDVTADATLPYYWTNQDPTKFFHTKVEVPLDSLMAKGCQNCLDRTFRQKSTRDRKEALAKRLVLVGVHRIEDQAMWARYALMKAKIKALRGGCTPVRKMKGSGEVKTSANFRERGFLDGDVNEVCLWHGTSPTGAFGILKDGFNINKFAGSAAGTMFGPGAYFAECCSKSDEYARADISGLYPGMYALLLCRVVCGEMFRVTSSDIPAIEKALNSKKYDAVLGDREAAVGTYREFVVFDEAQIYPESVILYKREY